ncbi:MAG: hypothetical protein JWO56_544, partial [Acidobacteria bacterium]|nr:hypothetical protein [Acidobacteriota bacterium]
VRNHGTATVPSLRVDFYAANPTMGATAFQSATLSTPLSPGAVSTIRSAWLVPNAVPAALFAVVRVDGGGDADASNDSARLDFGSADPALHARAERLGTTAVIVARVSNLGNVASAASSVVFRNAATGALLGTVALPALGPDEATDVSLQLQQTSALTVTIVIDENKQIGDSNRTNNTTSIDVPPPVPPRRRAV